MDLLFDYKTERGMSSFLYKIESETQSKTTFQLCFFFSKLGNCLHVKQNFHNKHIYYLFVRVYDRERYVELSVRKGK